MGFSQALARLEDAVFGRLGEPANWDGVTGTVRVIAKVADQELRLANAAIVQTGIMVRVRKSEVIAPAEGQQVQLLDDAGNPLAEGLFVINGEPEIDRKGVWHCPARLV